MLFYPEMRKVKSNPFAELKKIHDEMNDFFAMMGPTVKDDNMSLNIWSNDNELVVTAELPGVDPAEIETFLDANQLIIKAEIKAEDESDGGVYHRRERRSGTLTRELRLPFDVDSSKVKAEYKYGILTVRLPKAEACKPKRIDVKSA